MSVKDIQTITKDNTVDIFTDNIDMYFNLYCEENNIQDMKKESQAVFTACLYYIYNHVFKDNKSILKDSNSNYGSYDIDTIDKLCDYYIYNLCNHNNKICSIYGFSTLTGININTILQWAGHRDVKASPGRINIYKKLRIQREESLSGRIADGKVNPVGPIAILNHEYAWSTVAESHGITKKALQADELPKLGQIDE